MRNLLNKILQFLNISGRDWAVFLLSLLLAFSIWLIHNLSLKYTEFMQASVVAECNIEGHSGVSANRCDIIARGQTTGYNIISNGLFSKNRKVTVRFEPSVMKLKTGELYYITSSDLKESAHLIFGDDVQLEYFITDTLFFRFPYESHKRVAVNPVHIIGFAPQYMASGALKVEPDSVTIYGEPHHLEDIYQVNTEALKLNDIKSNVHGMAKLEKINGIRLSEDVVHYSLPVSRFVEIPVSVPVQARNVPPGKTLMVYPSTVTATLKCAFPLSSDLTEGIRFCIDYNDFSSSIGGRCIPKAVSLPGGVLDYTLEPKVFECVLKDVR